MSTWKAWNESVVDHRSLTWATDELLSASCVRRHEGRDKTSHDITFSNNIIAECLSNSSHSKGEHSKGTLIHDYCSRIAVVGYPLRLQPRTESAAETQCPGIHRQQRDIQSQAARHLHALRGPKMNTENIPTACVRPRSPQWATC